MKMEDCQRDPIGSALSLPNKGFRDLKKDTISAGVYETVLLADFMPKTTYFWHPVSVKLWPFFEFHGFSETAVKLRTVSRGFSKCRCTSVKMLKN